MKNKTNIWDNLGKSDKWNRFDIVISILSLVIISMFIFELIFGK